MEPISVGMNVPQCCHYAALRVSKALPWTPLGTIWGSHPSMWTLAGSRDANLLQVAEQIYKGEYMVAPSMFPHALCNNFMKELQRQLSKHLTWACLQGERGLAKVSSRSWRHSWGLEQEDQALEARLQGRQSQSQRRRTHSRGRSGLRWWQSPSPSHPSWVQSPSPSSPLSHLDKHLHCSIEGLKMQHKNWVWWQGASPQKEEKLREQVWF